MRRRKIYETKISKVIFTHTHTHTYICMCVCVCVCVCNFIVKDIYLQYKLWRLVKAHGFVERRLNTTDI